MKKKRTLFLIIATIFIAVIILTGCSKPKPRSQGVVINEDDISIGKTTFSIHKPIGEIKKAPFKKTIGQASYSYTIRYPKNNFLIDVDLMGKEQDAKMENDDVIAGFTVFFLDIHYSKLTQRHHYLETQFSWVEFHELKVSYDMSFDEVIELLEKEGFPYDLASQDDGTVTILTKKNNDNVNDNLTLMGFTPSGEFYYFHYGDPVLGTGNKPEDLIQNR